MCPERWTGNAWIDVRICSVCHQPECSRSPVGGFVKRPPAGAIPSRLKPGEREYRGYQEWAVHPDEASFLLHRGYAIVDGVRAEVQFIHNEAFVTQIRVYGSDPIYSLEEKYYTSTSKERENAVA